MSTVDKKTETVTIKGTANGLLIRLREDGPGDFAARLIELEERLQAGQQFFRRGRAQVELGGRSIQADDLSGLRAALARYEIELEAVISGSQDTRSLAKQAGLVYKLPTPQNTRPPGPRRDPQARQPAERTVGGPSFDSAEALFVRRTLRSGQLIRHHSDIIILGDVNPGAEILAGGSVIVWGTVRGKVQAGLVAPGEGAVICALSLRPVQLGIGEVLALGGLIADSEVEVGPEIASVQDGAIVLESWLPRRNRF